MLSTYRRTIDPMAPVRPQGVLSRAVSWLGRSVVWISSPIPKLWRGIRPPIADFIEKHPWECATVGLIASLATIICIGVFSGGKKGGSGKDDSPSI